MTILRIFYRAARRSARNVREFFQKFRFQHIHGPRKVFLQDNQVALVLVGRNNGCFLDENIRRHLAMGVEHIVYVDNESSDNSIQIVKQHPNTSVFLTSLSFYDYQNIIRKFAVSRILGSGWVLAIDCDEIFDFVGSDKMRLPDLVELVTRRGHTCVVSQMLDLVPDCTLEEAEKLSFAESIDHFTHYSLKEIQAENYASPLAQLSYFLSQNRVSHNGVKLLYGGLRKSAFGENCCLTKHALFKVGPGVVPFAHPHVSTGLYCADFTALLKHYKFACGVMEREQRLLAEKRMANGEIDIRVEAYQTTSGLNLSNFSDRKNPSPEKLLAAGFLFFSDQAKLDFGIS